MIPAVFIPLVIQAASRLIKFGFDRLDALPVEKKTKALDKIEANEKKAKEKQS